MNLAGVETGLLINFNVTSGGVVNRTGYYTPQSPRPALAPSVVSGQKPLPIQNNKERFWRILCTLCQKVHSPLSL
jgi:hypothetical protein